MNWAEKFPKKLWIGTFEVPVHFVPADHEALEEATLNGCAVFDPSTEVYFCASLPLTKLLEIVHHELTHIVNYVADIEDGTSEEDICEAHGKVWSAFWINNPRYARWWMAACVAVRKEQQSGSPDGKMRRKSKDLTVEIKK